MSTVLSRLVEYPHAAVFDRRAHGELAIRLRHPLGARWMVADGILSVAAAEESFDLDLAQHTVASLSSELTGLGFEVIAVAHERLGALALVEGAGDENESNGDHLLVYTSPLWALMGGYAVELREARRQMDEALRQMVLYQAEDIWLDLWGALYATQQNDESDEDYARRIPEEAFRLRVNGKAIELAIRDITGKAVEIREPWRELFRLSGSSLSGTHHFPDEHYYGPFLIQPVARESIDWADVLEVVHRNRAAGIEVYAPGVEFTARHAAFDEYAVESAIRSVCSLAPWKTREAPLGVMQLDDNAFTLNHPVAVFSNHVLFNADGLAALADPLFNARNIVWASICLSGDLALGDDNAIFPRGWDVRFVDPPASMSDSLALSDAKAAVFEDRTERIWSYTHSHDPVEFDEATAGLLVTSEEPMRLYAQRETDGIEYAGMAIASYLAGDVLNVDLVLNVSIIQ